ncbi:MAG TPA: ATP-binding protein [Verrucomicrobiae bacterium]
MTIAMLNVEIRCEHDVVLARQRARQIAEALGYEEQDQVRIATAVSELARNAFQYARGGNLEFSVIDEPEQVFEIKVSDNGPGISNMSEILNGSYVSRTGMGLGLIGAKRLMDRFDVQTSSSGTTIVIGKRLPPYKEPLSQKQISTLAQTLARQKTDDPYSEIQRQNRELLGALAELEQRQKELSALNRELEDTNRGVVALYAELDQRADFLRRVSESKTRFFSNMTHEFRTPLNSIMSLAQMLADELDGPLAPEQQKQVAFIRRAAADLAQLVDELLDIAKIEAGKNFVRPAPFTLPDLFKSLRGALRPLLAQNSSVSLVFETPEDLAPLHTDESKLSQIIRNFISNALKFTERGEVRVFAHADGPDHVIVSVTDTGIGIAPENQARIFEEFEQVEGAHQLKTKGTGLGLPLAKALAELLGGSIHLQSELGLGSAFSLRIPIRYRARDATSPSSEAPHARLQRVLIIDDDEAARYLVRSVLPENFSVTEAASAQEGIRIALDTKPDLIVLDLGLPDIDGTRVLRQLKDTPQTSGIPVIVNTSRQLSPAEQSELSKSIGVLSKNEPDRDQARGKWMRLLRDAGILE